MTQDLIPFGKHKGKPIEILAEDKEYTKWLLAQPWFKTKYQNIHMFVINNFREPVDTPEHNELQVKFLDKEFCLKLAYFFEPDLFFWNSAKINNELRKIFNKSDKHNDIIKKKLMNMRGRKLLGISKPVFETGYDVLYFVSYGLSLRFEYEIANNDNTFLFEWKRLQFVKILTEIKPTIGDDFPSVLRQMKASMPVRLDDDINKIINCLLVRDYIGEGASREQFIQFFQSQHYRVVFTSDIENIKLPLFEEDFKLEITEYNHENNF